jgi:ribosomal protein S18 acetylase RimI-like enzyme
MTIENALGLSLNALADAMTHCFEGYVMPAHFTGPMEANMIRVDAIDLSSSLIATADNGEIVGTALVARRGKRCRIAAMAVAKSARRQGLGREILKRTIEDAKARGEEQVILEVIEQNPPAIDLYKTMGFEIQHRLIGFEGILKNGSEVLQPALIAAGSSPTRRTSRATAPKLRDCSYSDVASALRSRGFLASSWSMSPATIEQLSGPSRAVRCGVVFAVVGASGEDVVACRSLGFLKQPSREAVRQWIAAMAHAYPGMKLYLPAFFPEPEYKDAFEGSGLDVGEITQFQMTLDLT